VVKKKRKWTVSGVMASCLGFVCAVVLGAMLYGAMVYQLAGEQNASVQEMQRGGVLSLGSGTLFDEAQTQQETGGALCTVLTRSYQLEDGTLAQAITATPAAYLERLAAPGVQMQLITGFVIDDLDAVYALSGETGILAARSGEYVYLIEAAADQHTLYALGAGARRNEAVQP